MPYISMNEHLILAFIVSSNYSMNVFVDQICSGQTPSHGDQKAVQAAGKFIKDITKSFVINN